MDKVQLASLLESLINFFNSPSLLLLGVIVAIETFSRAVKNFYLKSFNFVDILLGLCIKIPMYITIYIPLKIIEDFVDLPTEWALMMFFVKEFVSTLRNWKAIAAERKDASLAVLNALIKFLSLEKFKSFIK
jgi:undecaprenyl pyrophosphate phosphatase UppP